MKTISIQGYPGSFHQEAARRYFGKGVTVLPCNSFKELVKAAGDGKKTDGGIMAIENSIAGSILPNYNLLQKSKLRVTGEIYLQIRQNLLANKGVKLSAIREVHSHPMALQQCHDYLDRFNWKLVETEDTALSAQQLRQHKSKQVAVIAGKLAAEMYTLEIITPDIHSLKNNYTRFLVLEREEVTSTPADGNKASISFHTDHTRGSLAKVLLTIADGGINLSKLQSFPIPGTEFSYQFHADMEFESTDQFFEVIGRMKRQTETIRIYGVYKKGTWY